MTRKFNAVWRKKACCLGVLPIFKHALEGVLPLGQIHAPAGADGGDGVLVDQVLPPLRGEHHGKGVEACDGAPHLEAVDQKYGHLGLGRRADARNTS